MATTRPYINHLLQATGITPACSEEERLAAEDIAQIFAKHGFEPEIQEFSASGSSKVVTAVLGIAAFLGTVLSGIGGVVGIVGLLLLVAAAVIFMMERNGRPVLSGIGNGGLSQNVIAYHKASGPLASPRNRPVVVVAHYDSPRAEVWSQMPYASYRPLVAKFLVPAMLAPAAMAVLRLLPFPDAFKMVLWLLSLVVALVPLANAAAIIMNRFVLPYTSGSVCNKSSVAAMLGVMNNVAPYHGENEFPGDVPFEQYFAEQRRIAEEAAAAAAAEAAARAAAAAGVAEEEEADDLQEAEDESALAESGFSVDGATEAMPALEVIDGTGVIAPQDVEPAPEDEGAAEEPSADEGLLEEDVVDEQPETESDEGAFVDGSVEDSFETEPAFATEPDDESEPEVAPEPEPEEPSLVNAAGNYRFGVETVRSLGMLPDTCAIEYEVVEPEPAPAPELEPEPATEPVDDGGQEPVAASGEPAADADGAAVADEGYAGDDAYLDDDDYAVDEAYEAATYREAYADEGLEFSRRGSLIPATPAAGAGLMGTLGTVGESAGRIFSDIFQRGREAISTIGDTVREKRAELAESRAAAADQEYDAAYDEALGTDADVSVDDGSVAAEAPADDELDATACAPALDAEEGGLEGTAVFDQDESTQVYESTMVFEAQDADDGTVAVNEDAASDREDEAQDSETPAEVEPASADAEEGDEAPAVDLGATVAQPALAAAQAAQRNDPASRPVETVDTIMATIAPARPQRPTARRAPVVVPDPAQPSLHTPSANSRNSLFDLPDPAASPSDPFAPAADEGGFSAHASVPSASAVDASPAPSSHGFTVISTPGYQDDQAGAYAQDAYEDPYAPDQSVFSTITADAPVAAAPTQKRRRGLGSLFGRKKKEEPSMGEYLGLGDDFDAKSSGRDIGSWDNFEDDWKGGATGAAGTSVAEMRDAITSLGDDELLGHDIWFVATGASEYDNAGIRAFLQTHRDKLRGVFLINLECVGAGQVAMLSSEGERRQLKGDKRIMNLVRRVSSAFHNEYGAIDMPYVTTDAHAAMSMSLRSLTLAGIDGPCIACSHSEEDLPYNVDVDNIDLVADVVTEVIRRS